MRRRTRVATGRSLCACSSLVCVQRQELATPTGCARSYPPLGLRVRERLAGWLRERVPVRLRVRPGDLLGL